jgi:hypothetical protein
MTNSNPNPATRFQPGNGYGGRMAGARQRLSAKFLENLAADFDEHGQSVMETVRANDPSTYLGLVAKLMPREIEAKISIAQSPGGLEPEQWARLREILAMVERIAPPGTSPDAVLMALENGLRSEFAKPVAAIEHAPTLPMETVATCASLPPPPYQSPEKYT